MQVAVGCYSSMVLVEGGKVYSFGSGDNGKLGHGDLQDQSLPRLVVALRSKRVVQVSAGYRHSMALVEGGEVYSLDRAPTGTLATAIWRTSRCPR